VAEATFPWLQRFPLALGVYPPGETIPDLEWLWDTAGVTDLTGKCVLDVGTQNGGSCFLAERLGAEEVVGADVEDEATFGFGAVRDFLGSKATYVRSSVYELPAQLQRRFDLVLFWGGLVKLRHPLLGLDALRQLIGGEALIATAVADYEMGDLRWLPYARYHRRATLRKTTEDWWFVPTIAALLDWCRSSGLQPELVAAWPVDGYQQCMVRVRRAPGSPEYTRLSAERPLVCQAAAPRAPAS
jgi:tRNA (mo5U34)-methyltransferase